MRSMRVVRGVLAMLAAAAMCVSCSDSSSGRAGATTRVHAAPAVTAAPSSTTSTGAACDRTPIQTSNDPEVQGIGRDATIYGLLFLTHPGPVRAGEELKIVWRMTGQGDLSVSYFAPDGRPGVLTFGPERHGGSNYDRPGDEWGTGFALDAAGCWHIHLERSVGSGDVWLAVAPA
jgi:hypothetical protein